METMRDHGTSILCDIFNLQNDNCSCDIIRIVVTILQLWLLLQLRRYKNYGSNITIMIAYIAVVALQLWLLSLQLLHYKYYGCGVTSNVVATSELWFLPMRFQCNNCSCSVTSIWHNLMVDIMLFRVLTLSSIFIILWEFYLDFLVICTTGLNIYFFCLKFIFWLPLIEFVLFFVSLSLLHNLNIVVSKCLTKVYSCSFLNFL